MRYVMGTPKTATIPVRLDAATTTRVKKAAKRLRTSSSSIIRLSVAAQLAAIESGTLRVPMESKESA